jgi:hypothetical protein
MNLLLFLLVGFGVTTIVSKSTIFEGVRNRIDNGSDEIYENFFGMIIRCPRCLGFWVGVFFSLYLGSITYNTFSTFTSSNGTIFSSILFYLNIGMYRIFDGAIISGVCWIIHNILDLTEKAESYYETSDIYYQMKGAEMMNKEKKILKD